jgi:hypothetical protein
VSVIDKTLVANTQDTVTFVTPVVTVEVLSDGAAELFFTIDGTAPTIGGQHCYVLPAGAPAARTVSRPGGVQNLVAQVQLLSAGTPKYSVTNQS